MNFDNISEGHDDENPELHFYYNREERLAHAPKIVQDFYNGKGPRVEKNLFKWLVATPFNKVIFISLIAVVVLTFVLQRTVKESYEIEICGAVASLSAFSYAEKLYVSLKIAPQKNKETDALQNRVVPLVVKFLLLDTYDNIVETYSVTESYDAKEVAIRKEFVDDEIEKVKVEINLMQETKTVFRKVEKQ